MRICILDFIPAQHHAEIRNGVSQFDCANAVDQAIASSDHPTNNPSYRAGPAVYFPHGTYRLSRPIRLRRRAALVGEGSGLPYGDAAILTFDPGAAGVIVEWFAGNPSARDAGAGSIIRGLALIGSRQGDCPVHGVTLRARALIAETFIAGFEGDGVHIAAGSGRTDAMRGNANNWRLSGVRIEGCGGNGLFVDGEDANAGLAEAVDASNNDGWGVYDSSYLGNTYVACHVAENEAGAYLTDNKNATSVFIGCYSEAGQGGSMAASPSLVIGGHQAAGFRCASTAPVIRATTEPMLAVSTGVETSGEAPDRHVTVRLGGNPGNGDILYAAFEPQNPGPWRLRFHGPDLRFDRANLDAAAPFVVTGPETQRRFGRQDAVPDAMVLQAAFIGRGDEARRHGSGAAAPTAGRHGQGDIVWNNAPSAGGHAGWICVTGGEPGQWRPFGAIM